MNKYYIQTLVSLFVVFTIISATSAQDSSTSEKTEYKGFGFNPLGSHNEPYKVVDIFEPLTSTKMEKNYNNGNITIEGENQTYRFKIIVQDRGLIGQFSLNPEKYVGREQEFIDFTSKACGSPKTGMAAFGQNIDVGKLILNGTQIPLKAVKSEFKKGPFNSFCGFRSNSRISISDFDSIDTIGLSLIPFEGKNTTQINSIPWTSDKPSVVYARQKEEDEKLLSLAPLYVAGKLKYVKFNFELHPDNANIGQLVLDYDAIKADNIDPISVETLFCGTGNDGYTYLQFEKGNFHTLLKVRRSGKKKVGNGSCNFYGPGGNRVLFKAILKDKEINLVAPDGANGMETLTLPVSSE